MKNFIIGFMLGIWAKPILEDVARQLAAKNKRHLAAVK